MRLVIETRSAFLALLAAFAPATAGFAQPTVEFVAASAAHEYAARVYRSIWDEDGERIVAALEAQTCMKFGEANIKAIVDDAVSHSGGPDHPMGLRASYDLDSKRSTLVHELGHRHLWQLTERLDGVDGHRTLDLILERGWAEVWGEEFAAARVRGEAAWRASYDYAAAWEWARALTIDQRGILWNRLLVMNAKRYCYAVYLEPKRGVAVQPPPAS
jgi:hypothetical protein